MELRWGSSLSSELRAFADKVDSGEVFVWSIVDEADTTEPLYKNNRVLKIRYAKDGDVDGK